MRNRVVYWMARTFEELGCTVLRFNFRGVEESEGEWDGGVGECDDAAAVCDWLAGRMPGSPLWMGGFSFGCYAGLRAAAGDGRVVRLFAVAPPVHHFDFGFMADNGKPLVVIQGDADEIVPAEAVARWAAEVPNARLHRIAGAGHFFPDHLPELQRLLRGAAAHDGSGA